MAPDGQTYLATCEKQSRGDCTTNVAYVTIPFTIYARKSPIVESEGVGEAHSASSEKTLRASPRFLPRGAGRGKGRLWNRGLCQGWHCVSVLRSAVVA